MRKGQASHLDWLVGFSLFITFVIIAFLYIDYLSVPDTPYSELLKTQGAAISDKIKENISWNVYRSVIIVTSNNQTNLNFSLDTYWKPEAAIDTNSIAILDDDQVNDSTAGSTPSQFDSNANELLWQHNLTTGTNIFYLIYTKNTSLSDLSYTSDLTSGSNWANNSNLNISFNGIGINSLLFNNKEVLDETNKEINFTITGSSSAADFTTGDMRTRVNYSNGIDFRIYNNDSKIEVKNLTTTTFFYIYFDEYFTKFTEYNGSTYTFDDTTPVFTQANPYNNTNGDFIDLYKTSDIGDIGIAVIGDGINFTLANVDGDYRLINITGVTELEIYLHEGDYNNALLAKDMFINYPEITIGIPKKITGISRSKYQEFKGKTYTEFRKAIGMENLEFDIVLENRTI